MNNLRRSMENDNQSVGYRREDEELSELLDLDFILSNTMNSESMGNTASNFNCPLSSAEGNAADLYQRESYSITDISEVPPNGGSLVAELLRPDLDPSYCLPRSLHGKFVLRTAAEAGDYNQAVHIAHCAHRRAPEPPSAGVSESQAGAAQCQRHMFNGRRSRRANGCSPSAGSESQASLPTEAGSGRVYQQSDFAHGFRGHD